MDATKRMYIDDIMRRGNFYEEFDFFAEVMGVPIDGEEITKESAQNRMRKSQAIVYFEKLKQALVIESHRDK